MDPSNPNSYVIEMVKQNWYIFAVMALAVVVSIVYNIGRMRKMKSTNASFLSQNPDAAKIYLTTKALITSEAVTVYTVDGGTPNHFSEGGKTGFYVRPGQSKAEICYTYTRPGVMHKTVTTTTDVVEKVLMTEPYKSYLLGFDRKEEVFTFEEISE